MSFPTLSIFSLPHSWAYSYPVALILLVSYSVLSTRRFGATFFQISLLFSVLGSAVKVTRRLVQPLCGKLRAIIAVLTYRTLAKPLHCKPTWVVWCLAKPRGQSPERTYRAQSPWLNESFRRDQYGKAISSTRTTPTTSSHALSTTMPWTIKLSLAVLWVCLCTINSAP